jgi:DNA modification methylase
MDGKKADMVFTDPPYGIALSGKKNYASRKRNTKSEDYEKIIGDEVEFDMTKVFENIDSKKWWVWGADYLYRTRAINQSSESLGAHPTQKPTELGVRAIMRNTDEKGIVVDVFLGSGSTLIASEKTGRICYGMELDPKYVDVIIKRWEDYTGKAAILL